MARGVVGQASRGQERRVTLADVAERAGVSPALASIVMREAPGASPTSRRRVQTVAKELGYRPDARARSLASLKSRLIGVLFGRAGRFHFELIDGLYAAAEERGWNLVLSALTESPRRQRALDTLHDFRFDGLVMLGPQVRADPGGTAPDRRGRLARRPPRCRRRANLGRAGDGARGPASRRPRPQPDRAPPRRARTHRARAP